MLTGAEDSANLANDVDAHIAGKLFAGSGSQCAERFEPISCVDSILLQKIKGDDWGGSKVLAGLDKVTCQPVICQGKLYTLCVSEHD